VAVGDDQHSKIWRGGGAQFGGFRFGFQLPAQPAVCDGQEADHGGTTHHDSTQNPATLSLRVCYSSRDLKKNEPNGPGRDFCVRRSGAFLLNNILGKGFAMSALAKSLDAGGVVFVPIIHVCGGNPRVLFVPIQE
jgi:hypothetical protein